MKNYIYLARRYLFTKHHDAVIKLMIKICCIGILTATCCLALVMSIMTGFEQATYQKMQSIYPDLIIDTHDESIDVQQVAKILEDPALGIAHTAEQKTAQALLYNPECAQAPSMLIVRGINPQQESKVSNIATKIIEPRVTPLEDLVKDNQILIGSQLAQQLELTIGQTAYLLCCQEQTSRLYMKFEQTEVEIAGIFKTGIDELDMNMTMCHHDFFDQIFDNHPINQIHLRLYNVAQEKQALHLLQRDQHLDAYSWKDLYPTLLAALKLEKWAMILILCLIVFVASMNIMSLISMYITQKKRDIAILLCMGMPQKSVKKIFIFMSMMIASISSLIGLILAWTIGSLLQIYPCIKLPDNVYDTDYLPVQLELLSFCAIFILTIMISIVASILATRNVQRLKIIETLKTP